MIVLAVLFTVAVDKIDLALVWGKEIGFSKMNLAVHEMLGTSETFDLISDLVMVFSALVLGGMVFIGTYQIITGKGLKKVDRELILSGVVLVLTALVYVFFENVIINFRPVLEDGLLEASYPSTHVLLSVVVNILAIDYIRTKIENKKLRIVAISSIATFCVIGIVTRILCGMHWITDIVGALLISGALVMIYYTLKGIIIKKQDVKEETCEPTEEVSE